MSRETDGGEVARELTAERLRRGMSMRDVARAIEVSTSSVHGWEHAIKSPSIDNAIAWADALGYDLHLTRRPETHSLTHWDCRGTGHPHAPDAARPAVNVNVTGAEKDAVQVAVRPRRAGKTTKAVEWVLAGEATDSYPFWTRVLLTPTIEAADQARRQFPALDYRQVFAWNEWRSARLGSLPVEVALDNADILIAQTIGQVARFVTITGRDLPPAESGGEHTAEAPRIVTVRYRSPGGRWLTVTGEVIEPTCICDQITSRLFTCSAHPPAESGDPS